MKVPIVSFIVLLHCIIMLAFTGTVLRSFVLYQIRQFVQDPIILNTLFSVSPPPAVQTQSPVLQGKMLVPMATVRATPAPSHQFPLVAPPLPVQNGAQAGSKVRSQMGNS